MRKLLGPDVEFGMDTQLFSPDAPHSADLEAVDALASSLRAVDYSNAAIEQLLGASAVQALQDDDPEPARVALGRSDQQQSEQHGLATLVRLWLLGEAVTVAELDNALPSVGLSGVHRLNLVTDASDGLVRALWDLRPYEVDDQLLWVSSDLGALQQEGRLRSDHVLGVGQASLTLAHATVRTKVGAALDIGTGCGIQALHLLAHAEHVTVTDISARALSFARFNLALNREALGLDEELSRIEFLHGSLLEPVAGREFDLIVSNPPFVITPRTKRTADEARYEYRDGGAEGDAIVAALMRHLPEHLTPGGTAQMLSNWEINEGQQLWYGRVQQWLPAKTNCWVIQRDEQDCSDYARLWLRDAAESTDPAYYRTALEEYVTDFATRCIASVGFGLVLIQKPVNPARTWQRWEEYGGAINPPLGPTIERTVARMNELGVTGDTIHFDADVLTEVGDLRFVPAPDVSYEQHRKLGAADPEIIMLRQGTGFARVQAVSSAAAGLVGAFDGTFTAAELIAGYRSLLDEQAQQSFDDHAVLSELTHLYLDGFIGTAAVTD